MMASAQSASYMGRSCLYRRQIISAASKTRRGVSHQKRLFTSSRNSLKQQPSQGEKENFTSRAGKAWRDTKIEWKPIPIVLGVAFLGAFQLYRIQRREAADAESEVGKIPRRERVRPSGGGWQVTVMSTLPLKAISRIWGRFNELDIPYYLRVPGFKLYGWIFGVNFDEIKEPDLHNFKNLASFFYRELKPGVRPLDPNPRALLAPADGKILQFGEITNGEVEQVKGMTYGLDALLGKNAPSRSSSPTRLKDQSVKNHTSATPNYMGADAAALQSDEEFALINGISYTLPNLFSGSKSETSRGRKNMKDQSTAHAPASEVAVAADLASNSQPWWNPFQSTDDRPTRLYYLVIYLAPGDYHRFHSPVSWVCTSRRHFAGELYSVSPYVQRTLPGLFTLNERVVLLGQWKYGFFSYTPVGATNVGSIKVNFDKELRTNSLLTDTEADRQAAAAKERGEPYSGFAEATYEGASALLGGHPLRKGEEMGGFQLGSSIVMVFEAPAGENAANGTAQGGWTWNVQRGQKVKIGQSLGWVEEAE